MLENKSGQVETGTFVLLQHQSCLAEETVVRAGNSKHPSPFIHARGLFLHECGWKTDAGAQTAGSDRLLTEYFKTMLLS